MAAAVLTRLSSFLSDSLNFLGTEPDEVPGSRQDSRRDREIAQPLQRTFPDPDQQRHLRIFRQSAVMFRMIDVVQHVDDMRSADARRIVHAGVLVRGVLVQLLDALLGQILHVVLAAEVQAAGGTGFDAGRLQARAHAIRAQRALVDLLGLVIELREY